MSCFIVGKQTIDDVVTLLIRMGRTTERSATFIGRELWNLNIEAFSQRYSHNDEAMAGVPEARKAADEYAFAISLAGNEQLIKSLGCLTYQMCEGNVPDTPTYGALNALSEKLSTDELIKRHAYKTAYWGD